MVHLKKIGDFEQELIVSVLNSIMQRGPDQWIKASFFLLRMLIFIIQLSLQSSLVWRLQFYVIPVQEHHLYTLP